ncbi:MAG: hypothetical protein ACXWGY_00210, partial [Chthoniobacterales bacterium]
AEDCVLGRNRIEMERLDIKLAREIDDGLLSDFVRLRMKALADFQIIEVDRVHQEETSNVQRPIFNVSTGSSFGR